MLLDGFSASQLCKVLNDQMGVPSPKGKRWPVSTVTGILQNEKYCGDVITQKTITIQFLICLCLVSISVLFVEEAESLVRMFKGTFLQGGDGQVFNFSAA